MPKTSEGPTALRESLIAELRSQIDPDTLRDLDALRVARLGTYVEPPSKRVIWERADRAAARAWADYQAEEAALDAYEREHAACRARTSVRR
jgi:hypothetical protein